MSVVATLTGGGPWGFKMVGGKDFHQPLAIGKVSQKLKCGFVFRISDCVYSLWLMNVD